MSNRPKPLQDKDLGRINLDSALGILARYPFCHMSKYKLDTFTSVQSGWALYVCMNIEYINRLKALRGKDLR